MKLADTLIDRGWLPEPLLRAGIRRLLAARLAQERGGGPADRRRRVRALERRLAAGPVAVAADAANRQHYEVPAEFFEMVLGPRLKYSGCHWPAGVDDLAGAEEAMLDLTCRRAGLEDGMRVLDLGCGWGSLALWIAERYPSCRVLAISNSAAQRRSIEARARRRGHVGLAVATADVAHLEAPGTFDRVLSVEMFEHTRNWTELCRRIAGWLAADGRLFVHVFCHRDTPYLFEREGRGDWMAEHFFTGGLMPSYDLLAASAGPLEVIRDWPVGGDHYARTLAAWRANLDRRASEVRALFADLHGGRAAGRTWLHRWRTFFLACEELFTTRGGREWLVGHYLLRPRGSR